MNMQALLCEICWTEIMAIYRERDEEAIMLHDVKRHIIETKFTLKVL